MHLLLWRHAEAEDAAGNFSDHERALTDKGRQQAKRMAAWLNARLPVDTRILVSPAVRAQQTAAALKREFTTSAALDTSATCASVIKMLGPCRPAGATLLVGHQPTLGEVASFLLIGTAGNLSVRKAAVWWFTLNSSQDGVQDKRAELRVVMSPGML